MFVLAIIIQAELFAMNNYHKRLVHYLSEPKHGLYHKSSSRRLVASPHRAIQKSPYQAPHLVLERPFSFCQQCKIQEKKIAENNGLTARRSNQYQSLTNCLSNEYYGKQIKDIRRTLIQIRDQVKQRKKPKQFQTENYYYSPKPKAEYYNNTARITQYHTQMQSVSSIKIKELSSKVDQLQNQLQQLQRKCNLAEQKCRIFQNRQKELQDSLNQHRSRTSKLQTQKNRAQEFIRNLEIRNMQIRQQYLKQQQLIKDIKYQHQQAKYIQEMKKASMRVSSEVNLALNSASGKLSKSSQTALTEVDIERGYQELNRMQDALCDRINGNLKTQKKIFMRIQDIEENMKITYDKLKQLTQYAQKIGCQIESLS